MLFMAGKTRIGSHQNFDPSLLVATQKTLTDFREDEASTQKKKVFQKHKFSIFCTKLSGKIHFY